jgi:hypothetical protein
MHQVGGLRLTTETAAMTGPIRPSSSNPTPRPVAQPQAPAAAARAPGAGQAPAGPPGLGGAPARAASGQAAATSSAQRSRGSAPTRTASTSRAGSSSRVPSRPSVSATPHAVQLGQVAQRLQGLEQRRAEVAGQLAAAKKARREAAGKGGNAEGRKELAKLQGRLGEATERLQGLRVGRSVQMDRLERAENLLRSCERSLAALSTADEAAPSAAAPEPAAEPLEAASSSHAPVAPAFVPSPRSPQETAARERVTELTRALASARTESANARQMLVDGRSHVEAVKLQLDQMLQRDSILAALDGGGDAELEEYLQFLELPPTHQRPATGQPDTRYSQYVEKFTEVDASGATRFSGVALSDPSAAFMAMSALFRTQSPSHHFDTLLMNMVREAFIEDMAQLSSALRQGGANLEALVRPRMEPAWQTIVAMSLQVVEAAASRATGPRHTRLVGVNTRRTQMVEVAERNRLMVQLQANPEHRAAVVEGAVMHACGLLRRMADEYAEAAALIPQAEQQLKQTMAEARPGFARGLQIPALERELADANEQVSQLSSERRRADAAAAKAAAAAQAPPARSGVVIPETIVASSSSAPNPETQAMRLRGDLLKHTEAAERAQREISQSGADIAAAEGDLRAAEDQLDTAAAAHAQRATGARRQHGAQRQQEARLQHELDELGAQVDSARTELAGHSSRTALISDRAWERAIERHVEPDDAALRARARFTGYAGAYASRANLAMAVSDIHTHVLQQPQFHAVMAATSRAEFERAAAAVPGGVTDLVHDHGRPVGRGFSNDADQTARPTELTQSNFSLQFVQGRVVVTHIYPYVPHRDLTTGV